jgi:hypothetical protein
MTRGRALLIGATAVAVFLIAAFLLGAGVLFVVVIFLIGPHGVGILPEWSHIPVLALCAGAVVYASFKLAYWAQMSLASRLSDH